MISILLWILCARNQVNTVFSDYRTLSAKMVGKNIILFVNICCVFMNILPHFWTSCSTAVVAAPVPTFKETSTKCHHSFTLLVGKLLYCYNYAAAASAAFCCCTYTPQESENISSYFWGVVKFQRSSDLNVFHKMLTQL